MANKNPLSEIAAVLNGPPTRDQAVAQTLASVTGSSSSSLSSGAGQTSALTDQLTTITQQLEQLQTINQSQIETLQDNTRAVDQSSTAKGPSGTSTASSIGSTLLGTLGLGSGLSPLISGLVSLFGGGGSSQPAAPTPFVMPLAVHANAGISASSPGAFAVDNTEGGPRPAPAPSSSSSSSTTQVTVQVQAMDSKSFLDHSNDIALAVRQAMLETSVLNDVIRAV